MDSDAEALLTLEPLHREVLVLRFHEGYRWKRCTGTHSRFPRFNRGSIAVSRTETSHLRKRAAGTRRDKRDERNAKKGFRR